MQCFECEGLLERFEEDDILSDGTIIPSVPWVKCNLCGETLADHITLEYIKNHEVMKAYRIKFPPRPPRRINTTQIHNDKTTT